MNPYIKQQRNIVQKIRLTFEQERNVEKKRDHVERKREKDHWKTDAIDKHSRLNDNECFIYLFQL